MGVGEEKSKSDWKEEVRLGGSLRHVPLEGGDHGWASPPANSFMVRGRHYFSKKGKVPSSDSLLQPLGVDWLRSNAKLDHVMAHPENRVFQAYKDSTSSFILAINLQVPGKEHHSAVFYFVTDEPILEGSLLWRFIHEDDSFRSKRFKLINRIVIGPWIVRAAVGKHTACLLGKALACTYFKGRNYMEVDVDIGSSTLANAILRLALGYVTSVSVDLAFLIESQTAEELPEELLGAVRIAQIEMEAASFLEAPPVAAEEQQQPSMRPGLSWRNLRKSLSRKLSSIGNGRIERVDGER